MHNYIFIEIQILKTKILVMYNLDQKITFSRIIVFKMFQIQWWTILTIVDATDDVFIKIIDK